MSYILAYEGPGSGAEDEIVLVHGSGVLAQPSLGLERMRIWAVDIFIVSDNGGVHADAIPGRNMRSCNLEPTRWRNSGHRKTDAWVQTHGFLDGRTEEW